MELDVLCRGFVNPWGHHFDRWGQSFATDGACGEGINHVFPGGSYSRPPAPPRIVDGLNPGSPKHCGLEIVSGRHFPRRLARRHDHQRFPRPPRLPLQLSDDGSGVRLAAETEVIKTQPRRVPPDRREDGPGRRDLHRRLVQPDHSARRSRFPRPAPRPHPRPHLAGRPPRAGKPLQTAIKKDADVYELLALLKEPEEWTRQNAKIMLKHHHVKGANVNVMLQRWLAGLDKADPNYEHHLLEGLWLCECIDDTSIGLGLLPDLAKSKDHRIRAAATCRTASHWRTRLDRGDQKLAYPILSTAVVDQHPRVRLEGVRGLAMLGTESAAHELPMPSPSRWTASWILPCGKPWANLPPPGCRR